MPLSGLKNFRVTQDSRGVLTVAIDVPGRTHNVFTEEVLAELQSLLDKLEHDPTIRLVLFRSGKESGFLAGGDLRMLSAMQSRDTAGQIVIIGQKLLDRLERLPTPTVAAIHGPCLGGGLEFALACRYRLARDDASTRLGVPEIKLGLLPAWGGTQRLPELVGLTAALPMLLAGAKVSARHAAQIGLVDGVWPAERFADGVEQFVADRLARRPFRRPQRSTLARLAERSKLGRWFLLRAARRRLAPRPPLSGPAGNHPGHRARAAARPSSRPGLGTPRIPQSAFQSRLPQSPAAILSTPAGRQRQSLGRRLDDRGGAAADGPAIRRARGDDLPSSRCSLYLGRVRP